MGIAHIFHGKMVPWIKEWRFIHGFATVVGVLLGLHLLLWWQVPSTLWLIPLLSQLPFSLIFSSLLLATLGIWALAIRSMGFCFRRGVLLLAAWGLICLVIGRIPFWASSFPPVSPKSALGEAKVLMVSLDGLRFDVAQSEGLGSWRGTAFSNVYTPVPATRLLFGLLWGGNPTQLTAGHAIPPIGDQEEKAYPLLDAAKDRGWAPRFYIDDGGTIGLSGRSSNFDEVLMPASGWENFASSNLAAFVPLFAAWHDALRLFPGTHPWASMDTGLKSALEQGRGSGWVMFHSCLTHQPIYLSRSELNTLGKWKDLKPSQLRPIGSVWGLSDGQATDPRGDPLVAYRIRVNSILSAWRPVWESLSADPNYRNATRFFFSDHGERFFHLTESVRAIGVHGYDLDPWELRVPLVIDGPGWPTGRAQHPTSLLLIREIISTRLFKNHGSTLSEVDSYPNPVARYLTVSTAHLRPNPYTYKELTSSLMASETVILPGGHWGLHYRISSEERGAYTSFAEVTADSLTVYKPLLDTDQYHKIIYDKYELKSNQIISGVEGNLARRRVMGKLLNWH
jgi:hypothetical protein